MVASLTGWLANPPHSHHHQLTTSEDIVSRDGASERPSGDWYELLNRSCVDGAARRVTMVEGALVALASAPRRKRQGVPLDDRMEDTIASPSRAEAATTSPGRPRTIRQVRRGAGPHREGAHRREEQQQQPRDRLGAWATCRSCTDPGHLQYDDIVRVGNLNTRGSEVPPGMQELTHAKQGELCYTISARTPLRLSIESGRAPSVSRDQRKHSRVRSGRKGTGGTLGGYPFANPLSGPILSGRTPVISSRSGSRTSSP